MSDLLQHFGAYHPGPHYHGTSAELEPGDLIEPNKYPPTTPDPDIRGEKADQPRQFIYFTPRKDYITESYGPNVYEIEPTGEYKHDPEYGYRGGSRYMYRSKEPLRAVRKVTKEWGLPHGGSFLGPWTAADDTPAFPNPYHGNPEFGGRPEFSHTWFHGTRGEPEFGERKGYGHAERMKLPPEERMKGMGWPQPNQMLGIHMSPLHEVGHKFAPSVSDDPSAIVHARLNFASPAHYPTEHHLNLAVAGWAQRHYPHWHDPKLNEQMGWSYSDQEGTRRDFSRAPDDPRQLRRLGDQAQSLLQWHPHLPEIIQGFHKHLRDQGHQGITYGNNLEGPYSTDATRGGEASMKYIRKRQDWPSEHPYHISAIAQPEDIQTTHVEHIAPWRTEPQPHERTWEQASELDEPDEMRDRVMGYHRTHGGAYPGLNKTAAAAPQLETTDYEGTVGDHSHITRTERGMIPTSAIAHLPGASGEVPGEHRNKQGQAWEDFRTDIATHGVREPIFITVDHGQDPVISEGSHRRDAAVESHLPHVPAEIRYYGHAERQGTVLERARCRTAACRKEGAAGLPADLSDLRFEHTEYPKAHFVKAYDRDDDRPDHEIGYLSWPKEPLAHGGRTWQPGEIGQVWVTEEHRRRGVAAEMLRRAREIDPEVHHSGLLSGPGRAWSEKTGTRELPVTETGPLYHGTTEERARQILARGFRGGDGDREGIIYLTPHPDLARSYAEGRVRADGGGAPVTLTGISWSRNEKDAPWTRHDFPQPLRFKASAQNCYFCHEPLHQEDIDNDASSHEECEEMHSCPVHGEHDDPITAENHRDTYTDWSGHLPFASGIHRGFPRELPAEVHNVIHDPSRPVAERAEVLRRHLHDNPFTGGIQEEVPRSGPERYREGRLGVHWTPSEEAARSWGGEDWDEGPVDVHGPKPSVSHIVLHAESPHEHEIETDPDKLEARHMYGFDHPRSEREVPLKYGAPVRLTGLSWKRGGQGTWTRHDFTPPAAHIASSDGDRWITCDKGHDHWGANGAAGMLIRHKGDDGQHRYLLQKRDAAVHEGGTWSVPGGAIGKGETPEQGALRETREELGSLPRDLTHHHTVKSTDCGNWAYHTCVYDSPEHFLPRGGGETEYETAGTGWFTHPEIEHMRGKGLLHPAFAKSWDKVRQSRGPKTAAAVYQVPRHPDLIHRVIHEREWQAVNQKGYFEPAIHEHPQGIGGWHPMDVLYAASRPVTGYSQKRGPHRIVTFNRHQHGWRPGEGYSEDEVPVAAQVPHKEVTFVNPGRVPVSEIHSVSPPLMKAQLDQAASSWHQRGVDKTAAARHSWDYHGTDPYAAKHRTCRKCGITAKTFGVGAGRIWSYSSPEGKLLGSRTPTCEPVQKTAAATKTKAQVNYRPATGPHRCGSCVMFRLHAPDFEAGACTLVKGLIDEHDTCDEWALAKSKTAAAIPGEVQSLADSEPNRAVYSLVRDKGVQRHPELAQPLPEPGRAPAYRKMLGRASFFLKPQEIEGAQPPSHAASTLDLAHHAARYMTDRRQALAEALPRESWDTRQRPSEMDPDDRAHGKDFVWHYALALDGAGHGRAADQARHDYHGAVVQVADHRYGRGLSRDFPGSHLSPHPPPDLSHLPPAPPEQQVPGDSPDYSRKLLDLAKNPVPGTRIWRGEQRDAGEHPGSPGSVGIHWTVRPESVITDAHDQHEGRPVIWQARLSHPEHQAIPRSHPMWSGQHRSFDPEAEVRLRPGTSVHVEGAWVGEHGPHRGPVHPDNPGRNGPGWSWHPVGREVPVKYKGHGATDYSGFGIPREAALGSPLWDSFLPVTAAGSWDRSGDEPRWVQPHNELVRDALLKWKGSPTDMHLHMRAAERGEPPPGSGSGKQMRAQAEALMREVRSAPPNPVPLYRGDTREPSGIQGWTTRRPVAERFARLGGGQVHGIPAQAVPAIRISDYLGKGGIDQAEHEWIAHIPVSPGRSKTASLWDSFEPVIAARKASDVSKSLMLAIVPPGEVLDHLQEIMAPLGEQTEPRAKMHITLLYLGEEDDHPEAHLAKLPGLAQQWAKTQQPFRAKLQGTGTFINGDSHVLHGLFDIPRGHQIRSSLEDFLHGHGIHFPQDHGFTPHLTLAYADHRMRFLPKIEPHEWKVGSIWYCRGSKWQELSLTGRRAVSSPV